MLKNVVKVDDEMVVPVSYGEVVDKITILQIKMEQISDPDKLKNIKSELDALSNTFFTRFPMLSEKVKNLIERLREINNELWNIEDNIRDCERAREFGEEFIRLARLVYFTNDRRSAVKREINVELGSRYVEEKSYQAYS